MPENAKPSLPRQRDDAPQLAPVDIESPLSTAPGLPTDPAALVDRAQRHLQSELGFNLDRMLKAWEQGYIEAAMTLTRGNVSQAAKMLGVNRTTLYSRIESLQKQQ